jgi:hypothetical protein
MSESIVVEIQYLLSGEPASAVFIFGRVNGEFEFREIFGEGSRIFFTAYQLAFRSHTAAAR